jgi:hypothetical protein
MEPLFLGLLVFVGLVPLVLVVKQMTRGRPTERYERRAWSLALISAVAALAWFIVRILGLFSSGEVTSSGSMAIALTRAVTVVALMTGLPALVALTLTVIATRRHRAKPHAAPAGGSGTRRSPG